MLDADRICAVCQKQGATLCGNCRDCSYCSKQCQKFDWKSHKVLCAARKAFDMSSRPSPMHILGIFFPDDETQPKFMWVETKKAETENYTYPIVKPIVNPPAQFPQVDGDLLLGNSRTGVESTDRMPRIWFRDSFYSDGSIPTKSMIALAEPYGGLQKDWHGPLLLACERLDASKDGGMRMDDINLGDLRTLVDYSTHYIRQVERNDAAGERHFDEVERLTGARPIYIDLGGGRV